VPPAGSLLAYLVVPVLGAGAMAGGAFALDVRDGPGDAWYLLAAAITCAAAIAVARRTFGRPFLRRQTLVSAALAPVALALVTVAVTWGLDLAGADCPRSGMDYVGECNDLAGAAMLVVFVGLHAVGLALLVAALLGLAALRRRA